MRIRLGLAIYTFGLAALSMQPAQARLKSPVYITRGAPVEAPRGFVDMCRNDKTFCMTAQAKDADRDTAPGPCATRPATPLRPEEDNALPPPCTVDDDAVRADLAAAALAQMPTAGLSARTDRFPHRADPAPAQSRNKSALLKEINTLVNGRVRQRPDIAIYAKAEHWARSGIGAQAVGDCEDLAIEKRHQLLARGFNPNHVSFAVVFSAATGLHTVLVARTEEGDMVLDSATPWIRRADQTGYSWISIQSADDQMSWFRAQV